MQIRVDSKRPQRIGRRREPGLLLKPRAGRDGEVLAWLRHPLRDVPAR